MQRRRCVTRTVMFLLFFAVTGGFVENVGLYQQFILKLDLYKFLKNYPALKNSSLHHIILEIILKCSIPLVKTTKNYSHSRRTAQIVLSITIVFNLFSLFCCEALLVRLFLFSRDFFFSRDIFISAWEFLLTPSECFSWKLFYAQWKFLVNHKRRFRQMLTHGANIRL